MTIVNQQYRALNPSGASPREISEVVNNILNGKTNNTGEITLETDGASTTTIYDERIGYDSVILLTPNTAAAANIALPYGAWQDNTDQSAANTTTEYPITFNTTDYSYGISVENNSHLKVDYAGLYNVQFSFQLSNMSNTSQDVSIWFRKNGVDVPKSNSQFGLAARRNATDPYNVIASMNYFIDLAKNDYIEIMWSTTDILVTIDQKAEQTSPTRPSTPSVIATMSYISSDGYTSDIFVIPYVSSTSKGEAVITHQSNYTSELTYKYIVVG